MSFKTDERRIKDIRKLADMSQLGLDQAFSCIALAVTSQRPDLMLDVAKEFRDMVMAKLDLAVTIAVSNVYAEENQDRQDGATSIAGPVVESEGQGGTQPG